MSARVVRQGAALSLVGLLLAVPACASTSSGADSPMQVVTGAANHMAGARSFRVATTWQTTKAGGPFPADYSSKIVSYVDMAHKQAHSQITATTNGVINTVTTITVGGDQWTKDPSLLTGTQRPWFHTALRRGFSVAAATGAIDPTQPLRTSGADGIKTTKVGPAVIRDVATTKYNVTVPVSALGAAGAPATGPAHIEVWVDARGLIRRTVMTVPINSGSGTGPPTDQIATVSVDYWDFGAVDHVTPPPADQVAGG